MAVSIPAMNGNANFDAEALLTALGALDKPTTLSILKLASSLTPDPSSPSSKRTSDASEGSTYAATPGSLAVDLVHYKDLFTKLRFSYIETVTKEKLLRSLTSNPPILPSASSNSLLEAQLAEEKTALKSQKAAVASTLAELETRARTLATRYAALQENRETLSTLIPAVSDLEAHVATLRAAHPPEVRDGRPGMDLGLPATKARLEERQAEEQGLSAEVERLQRLVEARGAEAARLENEATGLGTRRAGIVGRADAERARREAGGIAPGEVRGRWMRAAAGVVGGCVE